jgi:hypothetical protein
MVFCIIGIVIFGILGIFSAKYRRYFQESIHCLSRQLMLKKCDTQFDQEMKAKISAGISKRSPVLARFVYRRFALLSWIMIILLVFSVGAMALGFYNYAVYGNCNGPESKDFCIFNPFGLGQKPLKLINATGAPSLGNPDAAVKIIEVGCYSCPYTKDAESVRNQILTKYSGNVSFVFKDMPLTSHNLSWDEAEAAKCAEEQGFYWQYHDKLFGHQDSMSIGKLRDIAVEMGMNTTKFNSCLDTHKYRQAVQKDYNDGIEAGIYATPTYFIDDKPIVGLKAFAQIEQIVIGEIRGSCPA